MLNENQKIFLSLIAIVGMVILTNITASIIEPLRNSGDDIRGKGCQDGGFFWNASGNQCQTSATNDTVETDFTHYSLSGVFDGRQGGVLFIAILGGMLLVIIGLVIRLYQKVS